MIRLVRQARTYLTALRVARRIRSLPPTLTLEEAFELTQKEPWYGRDSIAANQKREEILWLLEILRRERPRTVLEIGLDRGGTLFLWSRVAAPDALLVAVDIRPVLGRLGVRSPFALVRRSFARERQQIEFADAADSHDPATLERVRTLLGERPVDFLFIDGDHRHAGVRRDFDLYSRVVRPEGLIAFHDISPVPTPDTAGTAAFWQEFKREHETTELIAGGAPGYGIGLYRVPGA